MTPSRWGKSFATIATLPIVTIGAWAVSAGCSIAEGEGAVQGTLNVPQCWAGRYDLAPDFFAAISYKSTLQIRIQNGSDTATFSDGISILVDDTDAIRKHLYGKMLRVALSREVTPPGEPVVGEVNPALVHFSMYLQRTCRTQNVALYAVAEVALPTDGTCTAPAMDGVDTSSGCGGRLEAGVGTGKSTIAFTSLANGDVTGDAADRRIEGCFDVYLTDPREPRPLSPTATQSGDAGIDASGAPAGAQEATPGASLPSSGALPRCLGHVRGRFSYFQERGRPAQPFP